MMNTDASEYFLSRRPETGPERPMYMRVVGSLRRSDLTMTELCVMQEKDLHKIRGIGEKAREIIKKECQNYLSVTQKQNLD